MPWSIDQMAQKCNPSLKKPTFAGFEFEARRLQTTKHRAESIEMAGDVGRKHDYVVEVYETDV